ncbi:MAG TPA: gamma-glutamyl-gamma-aminobutyrate hydrolase family protein [Fimbriimonadaceae bacterium]|nr:gamma-glutamyl-gamma-aminobutyrate hydrolase family protein [Fimbriimonadaceae bacterium]
MKPIIGITVDAEFREEDGRSKGTLSLNWNYAEVIRMAGGVPLLIPPQADPAVIASVIDGWLIPGGKDLDPTLWGEETHEEAKIIDPARPNFELQLLKEIASDLPVLGICYGCQLLNVAHGGSLHQHLPDHTEKVHTEGPMDQYDLDENSKVGAIMGPSPKGMSFHHQAVNQVGSGLQVVGRSDDGTIEAIESTDRPWMIGVQWHPERTPDDPESVALFKSFVDQASTYRMARTSK